MMGGGEGEEEKKEEEEIVVVHPEPAETWSGIQNPGSMCHINAAVNLLFGTNAWDEWVNHGGIFSEEGKAIQNKYQQLRKLVTELRSGDVDDNVTLRELVALVRKEPMLQPKHSIPSDDPVEFLKLFWTRVGRLDETCPTVQELDGFQLQRRIKHDVKEAPIETKLPLSVFGTSLDWIDHKQLAQDLRSKEKQLRDQEKQARRRINSKNEQLAKRIQGLALDAVSYRQQIDGFKQAVTQPTKTLQDLIDFNFTSEIPSTQASIVINRVLKCPHSVVFAVNKWEIQAHEINHEIELKTEPAPVPGVDRVMSYETWRYQLEAVVYQPGRGAHWATAIFNTGTKTWSVHDDATVKSLNDQESRQFERDQLNRFAHLISYKFLKREGCVLGK